MYPKTIPLKNYADKRLVFWADRFFHCRMCRLPETLLAIPQGPFNYSLFKEKRHSLFFHQDHAFIHASYPSKPLFTTYYTVDIKNELGIWKIRKKIH